MDIRNGYNGYTSFHWCCANGTDDLLAARDGSDIKPDHVACMLLLLDYMANPTLMDQLGRTGRDIAALKGNYQLVAALDTRMAEKPWQEED